ncbi:MAG TPA: VOC family protein [Chitinophagales bacterium]|nr:VOC family protein [Chitinophagales bacterium]
MKNAINWFEIPVEDFDRAKKFYETVMEWEIKDGDFGNWKMGFFPSYEGKVSGAIVHGPGYEPSSKGSLVYLNCHPNMDAYLTRVEAAGGKITVPKTQISPEIGYWACFSDSEGNRVAFHSQG